MKYFYCHIKVFCIQILRVKMLVVNTIGVAVFCLLLFVNQAKSQTDKLTDEDIIRIKKTAEQHLSEYQNVMNRLIQPDLLNMVRVAIIKDGVALFTEHARLEVDYDTAYFLPNLTYEVSAQKYLGDFAAYHNKMNRVVYTDRKISSINKKYPENFYYLTISFTSVYDRLPPQARVATFRAVQKANQWQVYITYVKFKASPGSPFAFLDTDEDADNAATNALPESGVNMMQKKSALKSQLLLNNLTSGGKRGKRYLIGWRLPQDDAVSVQLLSQGEIIKTITTGQEANLLQWTIDEDTRPGSYQLKVVDEKNMASVTSPAFRISRRFPMALRIGLGVAAGFYVVQAIRNDWNFGWPFNGREAPPEKLPELPGPPSLPE